MVENAQAPGSHFAESFMSVLILTSRNWDVDTRTDAQSVLKNEVDIRQLA